MSKIVVHSHNIKLIYEKLYYADDTILIAAAKKKPQKIIVTEVVENLKKKGFGLNNRYW